MQQRRIEEPLVVLHRPGHQPKTGRPVPGEGSSYWLPTWHNMPCRDAKMPLCNELTLCLHTSCGSSYPAPSTLPRTGGVWPTPMGVPCSGSAQTRVSST